MPLIKNGKCNFKVKLNQNPSETEVFAAKELKKYLKKVFNVKSKSKHNIFLEINLINMENDVLRNESILTELYQLRLETYAIKITANEIIIAGRDRRGLLNGVYTFIEKYLGVHWLEPDRGGEFIPEKQDLLIEETEFIEEPAFGVRGIGDGSLSLDFSLADIDWMSRNKMNLVIFDVDGWEKVQKTLLPELKKRALKLYVGGHILRHFMPGNESLTSEVVNGINVVRCRKKRNHQEIPLKYFALRNGKRQRDNICYSCDKVVDIVVANAIAYLKKHPEIDVFGLWPQDGDIFCTCPECKNQNLGKQLLDFNNKLAAAAKKVNPNILIEHLSYINYVCPTSKAKTDPALAVLYCPYGDRSKFRPIYDMRGGPRRFLGNQEHNHYSICANITKWSQINSNVMIFSYYADQIMKASYSYSPFPDIIQEDLLYYSRKRIIGLHDCLCFREPWWIDSLNIYVFAKMLWNPEEHLSPILDGFYRGYFGEADNMMRNFDHLLRDIYETPLYHGDKLADIIGVTTIGDNIKAVVQNYDPDMAKVWQKKVNNKFTAAQECLKKAIGKVSEKNLFVKRIKRIISLLKLFLLRTEAVFLHVRISANLEAIRKRSSYKTELCKNLNNSIFEAEKLHSKINNLVKVLPAGKKWQKQQVSIGDKMIRTYHELNNIQNTH